jgi:hypothetical protein
MTIGARVVVPDTRYEGEHAVSEHVICEEGKRSKSIV